MPNRFILTTLFASCLAVVTYWFQQTTFDTDVLLDKYALSIEKSILDDSDNTSILTYVDGQLEHWSTAAYSFPLTINSTTDFLHKDKYGAGWMQHKGEGQWMYSPIYALREDGVYCYGLREYFANLSLSSLTNNHAVRLPNGQVLGYLHAKGPIQSQTQQWVFGGWLLLTLLAFIYSVVLLGRYAKKRFHSTWAGFIIIGGLFGVQFLLRWIDFPAFMPDLAVFNKAFYLQGMGKHLAFLLVESGMLLWIMVVFHRYFRMNNLTNKSIRTKFMIVVVMNWSILAGMGLVIDFIRNLVLTSGIDFHLEDIPNLDLAEVLAIISVCLMSLAYFVFSHRMVLDTSNLKLNGNTRLSALLVALLLVLPWGYVLDLGMPILLYGVMGLVYILLFDVYRESDRSSFTWLLLWLIVFAALSAGLLYTFQLSKDKQIAKELTLQLSQQEDKQAEKYILAFSDYLQRDTSWKYLQKATQNRLLTKGEVKTVVDESFKQFDYLKQYYDYEIHCLDWHQKQALIEGEKSTLIHNTKLLLRATDSLSNTLHHYTKWGRGWYWTYHHDMENEANLVVIGLRPKSQLTLHENFVFQAQKQWKNYHFSIWRDAQLEVLKGKHLNNFLPELRALDNEEMQRVSQGDWVAQLYRKGDLQIVVSNEIGDFYRPMTLFAYIFLMLIAITIVLVGINLYFRGVVISQEFPLFWSGSLRNKIQLYVMLLTLLCFMGIGLVTISSFKNAALKREVIQEELLFDNIYRHLLNASQRKAVASQDTAQEIIDQTAEFYNVPVNIYDVKGKLLYSNLSDNQKKQRFIPLMDPHLLATYIRDGVNVLMSQANNYLEDTKVGGVKFNIVGASPVFAEFVIDKQSPSLKKEEMSFIGDLLNIYVFLLLIAAVVGIVIANSISEPIVQMGEKLKQLKLGKNEPLDWKSNDEIGALINAYNETINQLEESTEKLKASERQGAWREMAKQVAHEIKNPLTPMKLNIQLLQRALKSDPERAQEMATRMTDGLVDQIETLAQIATEFSNFAKMPTVKKRPFVINDLLQNTFDFFKEGHPEVDFELQTPPQSITVMGDKEQLTRVFNNLIRNAIQALMDDRQGNISLSLTTLDGAAVIKVKDNGSGIPEEIGKRVFQPNFTTKSSGMGLGLAMTKGIVENCGGTIHFETILGEGTTFIVMLNLVEQGDV